LFLGALMKPNLTLSLRAHVDHPLNYHLLFLL
jgi:hypothetical protein